LRSTLHWNTWTQPSHLAGLFGNRTVTLAPMMQNTFTTLARVRNA